MKLWNVFRMEVFKNMHDRISFVVMFVLMSLNILGGVVISNLSFFQMPSSFEIMMILLMVFSVFGSVFYLFFYPYQLARVDYKNKVMSLKIASGLSREQYYFVKIGSILLFSLISIIIVAVIPIIIILLASGGININAAAFDFYFGIGDFLSSMGIMFLSWLSMFTMLMTSVILVKGKGVSVFVYFGISIVTSQLFFIVRTTFGMNFFDTSNWFLLFQHLVTIALMAVLGIVVLRKQDL